MSIPRVGVLGCGTWGRNLVRNFHDLSALAAVVDPSPSARDVARLIAPQAALFAEPEAVFADPSIHGIVVATPSDSHASFTETALLAGKDVLCEKPLALRYEDGKRLVALAEERGRLLMVGHILEYHPAVMKLRQLVSSGELGRIRYIYGHRLNLGKIRREENILWSFAPHDIAITIRLVGSLPFQVIALGGAYIQPNIADVTVTQLLFDSGVTAHIFVSWLHPFKEQRLVVVGSKRMATFDDVRKELVVHSLQDDSAKEGFRVEYASDEPLRLECSAFIEAIRTRKQPLTDGQSALHVLRILSAAQRSLMTQGQPVMISEG